MSVKTIGKNKHVVDVRYRDDSGRSRRTRRTVYGPRRKAEQWERELRTAARMGQILAPKEVRKRTL